jgi:hypothetical protein
LEIGNCLPNYLTRFERFGFTVSGLFRGEAERTQKIHSDILSRIAYEKLKNDNYLNYLQLVSASIQAKLDR